MGNYVYFNSGDRDGIETRFLSDIGVFAQWFVPVAEEFPGDYPPPLREKVKEISARGRAALDAESGDEANLIDRAVDEYWSFCLDTGRYSETDITPSAHKWERYAAELSEVLPEASNASRHAYLGLFSGRSIARFPGHAYQSEDGIFRLSWLLPNEAVRLREELLPYEKRLRPTHDAEAGVLWILRSLHEVARTGRSLVVTVA